MMKYNEMDSNINMEYTKKSYKHNHIKKWDWLLIVGVALAPMNGLRILKVGPSEVCCLLWCSPYIGNMLHLRVSNFYLKFWLSFIFLISLGTIYGNTFYPDECNVFGLGTYIYLAIISLSVYCGLKQRNIDQLLNIFRKICVWIPVLYFFLYIYSIYVSRSFFGAPLWYGNGARFSGGANNPHQLAILIGAVLFGNVSLLFNYTDRYRKKMVNLICIGLCLFIANAIAASTLVLTIVITLFFAIYIYILRKLDSSRNRQFFTLLLVFSVIIVGIVFLKDIYSSIYGWISSDANGEGRLEIFKSITYTLDKNFLIGLGPGTHGQNGTIEYHNTYLEVLAMSGVIGFSIFLSFSVKIFKKIWKTPSLVLLIIPLYCYGLAGFAMRRLAYWTILSITLVFSEKIYEKRGV